VSVFSGFHSVVQLVSAVTIVLQSNDGKVLDATFWLSFLVAVMFPPLLLTPADSCLCSNYSL